MLSKPTEYIPKENSKLWTLGDYDAAMQAYQLQQMYHSGAGC